MQGKKRGHMKGTPPPKLSRAWTPRLNNYASHEPDCVKTKNLNRKWRAAIVSHLHAEAPRVSVHASLPIFRLDKACLVYTVIPPITEGDQSATTW